MDLYIESDGDCQNCPRLSVLHDSMRFAMARAGHADAIRLENSLEQVADQVCAGCSREEPVATVTESDAVINLFPGARAA